MFTKMQNGDYMNRQENDILKCLIEEPYTNQRRLVEASGHSLGVVNRSLKTLVDEGLLDERNNLTKSAKKIVALRAPQRAIILAAGFGMRTTPVEGESTKGLLEIGGEPLIERLIKQLHEVNVKEIYIVVGFMKEQYEYLIDEYGVKLVVNPEYATKNNLHSLKLVAQHLENIYIIPCDVWCESNPFSSTETYSWYMVSDVNDSKSSVRVNRKWELVTVTDYSGGNQMIGISYLLKNETDIIKARIKQLCQETRYDGAFWEETLYQGTKMIVQAKVVRGTEVEEINTYEQLKEKTNNTSCLEASAIAVIEQALKVSAKEITNVEILKKGMTNRSYLFECKDKKYIMRISGEGTDRLINREQEMEVYKIIAGKGLCDDVIYINAENGYKITEFIDDTRVCDPENEDDLKMCMAKLKNFHEMKLTAGHEFNIFEKILYYESLWEGQTSVYRDYEKTKENVFKLRSYIDKHIDEKVLTHIDAVPDNFLFSPDGNGAERIQLIDWEYAGMQDPHVDIAMFSIYSLYEREQIDNLIDIYFAGKCEATTRTKIYCYVAACGLLWSNWCEFKRNLGVDFGEYALWQYRYAKDYYKIISEELANTKEEM